jgi:DNA primase
MATPVEQIKERLNIVDVVGSYIKVEKSGINFKAKCPFHNEKTASFYISPERGSFYCFGCNAKGDVFSFVEQFEGLDFMGALKVLATRAGVELTGFRREQIGSKDKENKEKLFELLEAAAHYFEHNLESNIAALAYLKHRGLTPETIKLFKLGFASEAWRNLYEHLTKAGYGDVDMEKVGLIKKTAAKNASGVSIYDRFRSRILFPLADQSGRIVGFSGRIFSAEGQSLDDVAKYLNSPETIIFLKSRVLFGFDKAKLEIRRKDFTIVVEGQIDLVMAHQAGFANTVALSGTALSTEHLQMLKRFSDRLIFAFDADSAGFRASTRSAREALALGMEVRVALLPAGKDPADMILEDTVREKEGKEKLWPERLSKSVHIIDFYLNHLIHENLDDTQLRKRIEKEVLPYVLSLGSEIERAHFIKRIAKVLAVSEDAVRIEVMKLENEEKRALGGSIKNPIVETSTLTSVVSKEKKVENIRDRILRKLVALYFLELDNQKSGKEEAFSSSLFEKRIADIRGIEFLKVITENYELERSELVLEAEITYDNPKMLKQNLEELLRNFEEEFLKESLTRTVIALRQAEGKGQKEEVLLLLTESQEISKKLNILAKAKLTEN